MDFVVIQSNWSSGSPLESKEIVLSLSSYDAGLGMNTRSSVKRQLRLDVPRSRVTIEGVPTTSWEEVYRSVRHPRMCTQAVLAPVVEWFRDDGVMLFERHSPMRVNIERGEITVRKKLGLRTLDYIYLGDVDISVSTGGSNVFVSLCTKSKKE